MKLCTMKLNLITLLMNVKCFNILSYKKINKKKNENMLSHKYKYT